MLESTVGSDLKPLVRRPWAAEFLRLGFLACDIGVMGYEICDHLSLGMSPVCNATLPFRVMFVVKGETTGPRVLT